jgi:hypothetical protein
MRVITLPQDQQGDGYFPNGRETREYRNESNTTGYESQLQGKAEKE